MDERIFCTRFGRRMRLRPDIESHADVEQRQHHADDQGRNEGELDRGHAPPVSKCPGAFSAEVGTGSAQKMRPTKRIWSMVRFSMNGICSSEELPDHGRTLQVPYSTIWATVGPNVVTPVPLQPFTRRLGVPAQANVSARIWRQPELDTLGVPE